MYVNINIYIYVNLSVYIYVNVDIFLYVNIFSYVYIHVFCLSHRPDISLQKNSRQKLEVLQLPSVKGNARRDLTRDLPKKKLQTPRKT